MHALTLKSFGSELEKRALSAALLARYAAKRGAQGIGGGARLAKGLAKAPGATSRSLTGFQGHLLKGVRAGGRDAGKAQRLATRVGTSGERKALQLRTAQPQGTVATPRGPGFSRRMSQAEVARMTNSQPTPFIPSRRPIHQQSGHPSAVSGTAGTQVSGVRRAGGAASMAAGATGASRPSALRKLRTGTSRVSTPMTGAGTQVARRPLRVA